MRLPHSAQEIADVIGRERALYLIGQLPRMEIKDKRWPGAKSTQVMLYVPTLQRLSLNHPLVRILGLVDAEKLCRVFGGEILKPANCADIYRSYRDCQILRFSQEGMQSRAIAKIFGIHPECVRLVLKKNQIPQEETPRAANDNAPNILRARAANGKSD